MGVKRIDREVGSRARAAGFIYERVEGGVGVDAAYFVDGFEGEDVFFIFWVV